MASELLMRPEPMVNFEIASQTERALEVYVTNDGSERAIVHRLDVCPPDQGVFHQRSADSEIEVLTADVATLMHQDGVCSDCCRTLLCFSQ